MANRIAPVWFRGIASLAHVTLVLDGPFHKPSGGQWAFVPAPYKGLLFDPIPLWRRF
ncbi:MAG TPA: hypothetical protein PLP25_02220 [Candidatus Limiplasma sp.]|nr:hypothetical protein [Candidatus Limiplasma sp.]HPS80662.1 hypothetical protein [Candidatus Limiplasma sp.]